LNSSLPNQGYMTITKCRPKGTRGPVCFGGHLNVKYDLTGIVGIPVSLVVYRCVRYGRHHPPFIRDGKIQPGNPSRYARTREPSRLGRVIMEAENHCKTTKVSSVPVIDK
jgi:hypothetical protein